MYTPYTQGLLSTAIAVLLEAKTGQYSVVPLDREDKPRCNLVFGKNTLLLQEWFPLIRTNYILDIYDTYAKSLFTQGIELSKTDVTQLITRSELLGCANEYAIDGVTTKCIYPQDWDNPLLKGRLHDEMCKLKTTIDGTVYDITERLSHVLTYTFARHNYMWVIQREGKRTTSIKIFYKNNDTAYFILDMCEPNPHLNLPLLAAKAILTETELLQHINFGYLSLPNLGYEISKQTNFELILTNRV